MSEIKATSGYLNLTGRIIGLNNKQIKEYPRSKEIQFGIQTKKDNIVYVKATGFKKNDDDTILVEYTDENKKRQTEKAQYGDRFFLEDGRTIIGTKIKKTVDGQVESMVDVDAIDEIKNSFKDGDVVNISLKADVNTYFKSLQFDVTKIFASSKEINFEDEKFEEDNHGRLWLSFVKAEDKVLTGVVFNKKLENIVLNFDLDTDYIKAEDFDFEQGRLIQIEYEFGRTPIYEEVEVKEDEKSGFKPKGKYASEKTNSGKKYQQVTGYVDRLVCTGISDAKEDVYDITPYLEVNNTETLPF